MLINIYQLNLRYIRSSTAMTFTIQLNHKNLWFQQKSQCKCFRFPSFYSFFSFWFSFLLKFPMMCFDHIPPPHTPNIESHCGFRAYWFQFLLPIYPCVFGHLPECNGPIRDRIFKET